MTLSDLYPVWRLGGERACQAVAPILDCSPTEAACKAAVWKRLSIGHATASCSELAVLNAALCRYLTEALAGASLSVALLFVEYFLPQMNALALRYEDGIQGRSVCSTRPRAMITAWRDRAGYMALPSKGNGGHYLLAATPSRGGGSRGWPIMSSSPPLQA